MALWFWDSVLWGQHSLSWAGFKPTQPWSTHQRQKMRRWEETFRSLPHVQCPKQNSSSLLAWRSQNLWKSSGDQKASEILPQMRCFHGSQVKALLWAWGKVPAAWAEHGKWLTEGIVRLEPVSSRLVTDCSLSHPASTATVTLESVLWVPVAGLRFCLLLVPAIWAGHLSGRRELAVDEQEQALGSVKKHRNVSASIPIPCPSKKRKNVDKRANEQTFRSEENINWLYSRVWAIQKTGND